MTQSVLICNFQYYTVTPPKKKVTDFPIESAVLSMRNLPNSCFLVFWLLMGFPPCNC